MEKLRFQDNETVYKQLSKLVDAYEIKSKHPVSVSTMSKDMLKKDMNGIIGFEIQITEIQAAEKLSQNRDEKNYNNIIAELEKLSDTGSTEIADAMKKLKK